MDARMYVWFYGILSIQIAAKSSLKFQFVRKTNDMNKRNHLFRTNDIEERFEIRICVEIFDIKIYTINRELQGQLI